MNATKISLGTITMGDVAIVSDPCYIPLHMHGTAIISIVPGEYEAYVELSDEGDWGMRVATIGIRNTDVSFGSPRFQHSAVPVDSGQMMILNAGMKNEWVNNEYLPDVHPSIPLSYNAACHATLDTDSKSDTLGGSAVVSSTGYGDGRYPVYVNVHPRETTSPSALEVRFLEEEDEDEEEEE